MPRTLDHIFCKTRMVMPAGGRGGALPPRAVSWAIMRTMKSTRNCFLSVVLIVSACALPEPGSEPGPIIPGSIESSGDGDRALAVDGKLDCPAGEASQGQAASTDGFGSAEEAAMAALGPWLADGAVMVALPDEGHVAVMDNREVAYAIGELEGDGRYRATNVSRCAPVRTGPARIDGEPDCLDDAGWGMYGSIAEDAVGEPTPEAALLPEIVSYQTRFGGTIEFPSPVVASLVIDGREVVSTLATELPNRTWVGIWTVGCGGYE